MSFKIFHKGSIFGGIFLIAGSAIGAGILALPIITGLGGYISSILMVLVCWVFMTFTGLLVLEVNSSFTNRVNIVSMADKSFGLSGRIISWILYLFLFYSLIVAYITASGNIFFTVLNNAFNLTLTPPLIVIIFVTIFGAVIYLGTTQVDFVNRIFMVGKIATYLGIIFLGLKYIQPKNFFHFDIHYSIIGLPILITSFGFHNMIPTIVSYMDYDYVKVKKAIIGGSFLILAVYLVWVTFVLGIVAYPTLFSSYARGIEASEILMQYLKSTWTGFFVQWFAVFAIITSFLGQSLALLHFIADGVKVEPNRKNSIWLVFLALLPPTLFALTYPTFFFKALSFAGGICAVILFCFLPALMVWKGRYRQQLLYSYKTSGGKISLIIVILFSLFIVLQEIFRLIAR
jgi:tyrosine-specific transport protein